MVYPPRNFATVLDNFKNRMAISFVFYLVFTILYFFYDFYNSITFVLPFAFFILLYLFSNDKIELMTRNGAFIVIGVVAYFLIIIFLFSSQVLISAEKIIKVVFEELLFRLCMIGVVKKYLDFIYPRKIAAVLIINSLLFSSLHFQYDSLWQYTVIFVQGLNFGLTYLSLGILPTICTHVLWNAFFPSILPQIPILIATVVLPLYHIHKENERSKMGRIMHTR